MYGKTRKKETKRAVNSKDVNSSNWWKRALNPEKSINNGDGSVSTHKMAYTQIGDIDAKRKDRKYIAYPTIREQKDGSLKELSGKEAFDAAYDKHDAALFSRKKDAKYFSKKGYKKESNLINNMYGKKIKAKNGVKGAGFSKGMGIAGSVLGVVDTYKNAKGEPSNLQGALETAGSIVTDAKGGIDKYKAGRAKKKPMGTTTPLMTGGDTTQTLGAGLGTSSKSPLRIDGAGMNWAKGSVPALKYGGKRKSKGKKKPGCK